MLRIGGGGGCTVLADDESVMELCCPTRMHLVIVFHVFCVGGSHSVPMC